MRGRLGLWYGVRVWGSERKECLWFRWGETEARKARKRPKSRRRQREVSAGGRCPQAAVCRGRRQIVTGRLAHPRRFHAGNCCSALADPLRSSAPHHRRLQVTWTCGGSITQESTVGGAPGSPRMGCNRRPVPHQAPTEAPAPAGRGTRPSRLMPPHDQRRESRGSQGPVAAGGGRDGSRHALRGGGGGGVLPGTGR
jgi:hypothetical protein